MSGGCCGGGGGSRGCICYRWHIFYGEEVLHGGHCYDHPVKCVQRWFESFLYALALNQKRLAAHGLHGGVQSG